MPRFQSPQNYHQFGVRTALILSCSLIAAMVAFTPVGAKWAVGQEDGGKKDYDPKPGLMGILPAFSPVDLTEDQFVSALSDSWESWAVATADAIATLYESETAEEQKKILKQLESRISVMDAALADSRYAPIHDTLADLRGRLNRRVEMSNAIINTLELDPEKVRKEQLAKLSKQAIEDLEAMERYLGRIRNGAPWIDYLETKTAIKALESEKPNNEEIASMTTTLSRLGGYDAADEAQRKFLGRKQFVSARTSLGEFVRYAESQQGKVDVEKLRESLADLVETIEMYEETNSSEAAARVSTMLAELSGLSADGGEMIEEVVRRRYQNYNFRIVVSEAFLNKFIDQPAAESGPVRDVILGANVVGTQTTNSKLGVNLLPSDDGLSISFDLSGTTNSRTRGYTSQAIIYTSGYQTFNGSKQVTFDGDKFDISRASLNVTARNNPYNAEIRGGGLAQLFKGTALRQAQAKRGQTEAIARSRLRNRILPRFNDEIDTQFSDANKKLNEKVYDPLRKLDLYPQYMAFRTTNDLMIVDALLREEKELGADRPGMLSMPARGAARVLIHESWINNAVSKMDLAGRTMTGEDIRKEFEKHFSVLLGRKFELPADMMEDDGSALIFDKSNPVRVKMRGGKMTLIIRAGLKRKNGEIIPTQEISVPLTFGLLDDKIQISRGDVAVAPVETPKNVAEQIARAGVIRNKIQQAIQDREVDGTHTTTSGKKVKLVVDAIKFVNGWMVVSAK